MTEPPSGRHVVVVGGGISGLAAAWFLRRDSPPGTRVTVLEGSDRVGGKLRAGELAGVRVDEGAESLLLRRPEAVTLAGAVGLTLEDAMTTSAAVWTRGRLRALPKATVMGVPTDLRALASTGLLGPAELARVPLDAVLPGSPPQEDVAVGHHVAARLGRGVVDRLVEPLLGGVYAGHADRLSLAATLPQLWPHVTRHRSLLAAARAARPVTAAPAPAVFGAPPGGVGRLAEAVAAGCGAAIRTESVVRALRRTPAGWEVAVGSAHAAELVEADAVVVAVPPAPAARMLEREVPAAAAELARVPTASMAVVSLAFRASEVPGLPGSGFLVPPVDGRVVKAATFSSAKWGWLATAAAGEGLVLLRASVGRLGEEATLQRDDADIVRLVLADLAAATGLAAQPVDSTVTRWGGGLPQYEVGHLGLVERVRSAVASAPGLAVCGAAYDGVGVPACIATAEAAVAEVLRQWRGE